MCILRLLNKTGKESVLLKNKLRIGSMDNRNTKRKTR